MGTSGSKAACFRQGAAALLCLLLVAGGDLVRAEPIKLAYWHHYAGDLGKLHEQLVAEFNQSHPHIQVDATYNGTAWTMRDKLLAAVAAGAPPDVSLIDQFWSAQLALSGSLVRLEDYLTSTERDDVYPLFWETASYGGAVWTMPFAVSNLVLYYSLPAFREAGLDPEAPPADWHELRAAGEKLGRRAADGRAERWGLTFPVTAQTGTVYHWIAFLWQTGGELFDATFTRSLFHGPEGQRALAFWLDLVHVDESVPLAPPMRGWETGRIAMEMSSSARLEALYKRTLPFEFGVAPLPADRFAATGVGGTNLAVFRSTPVREQAARTFVAWMTSRQTNLRWSMETGYLPLRRSVVESPEYQAYVREEPRAAVVVEQMAHARARPNIPAYGDASRVLGLAIETALFGRRDPGPLLAEAARDVDRILAEYR